MLANFEPASQVKVVLRRVGERTDEWLRNVDSLASKITPNSSILKRSILSDYQYLHLSSRSQSQNTNTTRAGILQRRCKPQFTTSYKVQNVACDVASQAEATTSAQEAIQYRGVDVHLGL
jgi:hypothetical protein